MAAAAVPVAGEAAKVHRGIPQAVFLENVEAYVAEKEVRPRGEAAPKATRLTASHNTAAIAILFTV